MWKHTIYYTFLQRCSFNFMFFYFSYEVMLWLIDLPLVTWIHMAEFTKLELWNAAKCENFSHRLAFPVWRIRMWMNGSQWNFIDWLIVKFLNFCVICMKIYDLYVKVWSTFPKLTSYFILDCTKMYIWGCTNWQQIKIFKIAVNCVVQIFLNVHFLSFILNWDYNEKYVFNPWFHRQGLVTLVISEAHLNLLYH